MASGVLVEMTDSMGKQRVYMHASVSLHPHTMTAVHFPKTCCRRQNPCCAEVTTHESAPQPSPIPAANATWSTSLRVTSLVKAPRHHLNSSSNPVVLHHPHSSSRLFSPITGTEPSPPPRWWFAMWCFICILRRRSSLQLPSSAIFPLLFPVIVSVEVTLQCEGGTQILRLAGLPWN